MMRLRLRIHRPGLSPTQILWGVNGIYTDRPTNVATITVSQFLEQINEILPLELDDWGLEDYAVEVQGYECLHFTVLSQILKEEDEVTIRPLHTADRRLRRVSGRDQIAADGRHLIDGVPFGRPFLRRTERPAIRFPLAKRIRVGQGEGEDEDAGTQPNQLVLRDPSIESDSQDEDEEEYNGFDDSDMGVELKALREDSEEDALAKLPKTRKRKRGGLGIEGGGVSVHSQDEDSGLEHRDAERTLDRYTNQTYRRPFNSEKRRGKIASEAINARANGGRNSRRSSRSSTKSVRFEKDELETPATIRAADDSEDSEDIDFDPAVETQSDSTESNKENIKPTGGSIDGDGAMDQDETSSSGSSDADTDESDDSSLSSSASDTSSDSGPTSVSESDSGSESSSEADSASESKDETSDSEARTTPSTTKSSRQHTGQRQGSEQSKSKVKSAQHQDTFTPSGQGLRTTQRRNERRSARKKLDKLKKDGVLPESATLPDYRAWVSQQDKNSSLRSSEPGEVLEAKKRMLLEAISPGGIDADQAIDDQSHPQGLIAEEGASGKDHAKERIKETAANKEAPSNEASQAVNRSLTEEASDAYKAALENTRMIDMPGVPDSQPMTMDPNFTFEMDASFTNKDPDVEDGLVDQTPTNEPRRRAKLDIASSRRLLFGSLGLRAPKTPAEERSIRNKLMEGVKPLIQPQENSNLTLDTQNASDDESWKDKIVLRAVECCGGGSELTTPPFPFIQGWDRQRRGPNGRGDQSQKPTKGTKKRRVGHNRNDDYNDYEDELEYDDAVDQKMQHEDTVDQHQDRDDTQAAIDKQLIRDSKSAFSEQPQVEDLPGVPVDLSPYEALTKENAKPRAVVVFKRICMSEATHWSPIVSDYRTAIIDRILETGRLEMTLAYRDKIIQEKSYDAKTGERTYSKFEMPDMGDEDVDDDGRYLEMDLEELIEPKIIEHGQDTEDEDRKVDAPSDSGVGVVADMSDGRKANVKAVNDIEQLPDAQSITSSQMSNRSDYAEAHESFGSQNDTEDNQDLVASKPDEPQIFSENRENHDKASTNVAVQEPARNNVAKGTASPQPITENHSKAAPNISEEARTEYSRLIKEAGFQSDVNSEVGRELHGRSSGLSSNSGVESMRSKGLSSMSGIDGTCDLQLSSSQVSNRISVRDSEDGGDEESEELEQESNYEPTYDDDTGWGAFTAEDDEDDEEQALESDEAGQESDGERAHEGGEADQKGDYEQSQESDAADQEVSSSPSYPDESTKRTQKRSPELGLDLEARSDSLIGTRSRPLESGPDLGSSARVPEDTQRELPSSSQRPKFPPKLDKGSSFNLPTDSDEEFPSITKVLSQSYPQSNPQVFDSDSESNSDAENSGIPPSTAPLPKRTQTARHTKKPSFQTSRKSKPTIKEARSPSSSIKSVNVKSEKDSEVDFRDNLSKPKSKPGSKPKYRVWTSQVPRSTHTVDLTVSSDLEHDEDEDEGSEYEDISFNLPTGPGWVKKTRNSYVKGSSWRPLSTERKRSTV